MASYPKRSVGHFSSALLKFSFLWLWFVFCFAAPSLFSEDNADDLILSTADQILTLNSDQDHLIGGLVSPISGQLCLKLTDLVAKGAQNVVLSRTYVPPYVPTGIVGWERNHKSAKTGDGELEAWKRNDFLRRTYKGWVFFPHVHLQCLGPWALRARGPYEGALVVRLVDPNGISVEVHVTDDSKIKFVDEPFGISNVLGEMPSGCHDIRNTRIVALDNRKTIVVQSPEGISRFYQNETDHIYLLTKEILANGKVLRYSYKGKDLCLIESLDPLERYVYASIAVDGTPAAKSCQFLTNTGQSAQYRYQQRTGIKHPQKRNRKKSSPPFLCAVNSPFYHHETLTYSEMLALDDQQAHIHSFKCHYGSVSSFQGPPHLRVDKLWFPTSEGVTPAVHTFSYQPPLPGMKGGQTTVRNSDGSSVVYFISKQLLPEKTLCFDAHNDLSKQTIYHWSDRQWLTAVEVKDAQNNLLHQKSYEYDSFGNPVVIRLTGDVTGDGSLLSSTIKRDYSQDGRNLLLREETDTGKVVRFTYLPGTNLVTSKMIQEGDRILKREFFTYDSCNNLICEIVDDGASEDSLDLNGVSQRNLKKYTLRDQQPFLHMVEWVDESYFDGASEKLLKRTHYTYDKLGNVSQEDVYDADLNLAYSLLKEYNERGDLLSETNALGEKAVYTYNEKGDQTSAIDYSQEFKTEKIYDAKGRLIEKIHNGKDGIRHCTHYRYDALDRLIEETDPYNNSTRYTYDPLTNKITQTDLPPIVGLDGQPVSVTKRSSYDALGRELSKTDENGHKTTYRYNALGFPIEITYPDTSQERFRYTVTGLLKSHTDRDGLTIEYAYDVLDRVTSKTYFKDKEEPIAQETYVYNAFQLLEEIDREKHRRTYSYDGAGRLISESHCGRVLSYAYDSLGRLTSILEHNGENTLCTLFRRDVLDRVLEKTQTDLDGIVLRRIVYSYDTKGNVERTTRFINGSEATEECFYDSLNRLVEKRDALGSITKTSYEEKGVNSIGQKAVRRTTIDPKNIATLVTYDAFEREVKREVRDQHQRVLSCQEMVYDCAGNLLQRQDHIHVDGAYQRTQTIRYQYTSVNQVKSCERAYDTPLVRTTTYAYTPGGQLELKRNSDGINICYRYDPFGSLTELTSSDGKVRLQYTYNKLGHLVQASDQTTGATIQREVDPFGNILSERLSTGLKIEKTYDCRDRPLQVTLPGQGTVHYQYDPLYLRSVTRRQHLRQEVHVHQYSEYDLAGNVVNEQLIDDIGPVHHSMDVKGRRTSCKSPYFAQQCAYDELDNLVESWVDGKSFAYDYDDLSQLSLEKGGDRSHTYSHDSNYNRVLADGQACEGNDLNELLSARSLQCTYDLNGNLVSKKTLRGTVNFTYDALNRLLEVSDGRVKVKMSYDPLGRRLSKTVSVVQENEWTPSCHENYLYDDENEVGAFGDDGQVKQLRILGLALYKNAPQTVAIELDEKLYVPLMDCQGNIRRLVDPKSKKVVEAYDFSAFGEQLGNGLQLPLNPWRYASKRTDPEFNLINFGKRYYDPELGRWLTTDPAGFVDSTNLYVYLFNSPFRYIDPDGRFAVFVALDLLAWGGTVVTWFSAATVCTALTGALVYGAISWGMDHVLAKDGPDDPYETEEEYERRGKDKQRGKEEQGKKRPKPRGDEDTDPPPIGNDDQRRQAEAAKRTAERQTGKKFSKDQEREFHDRVTKRGYGYKRLVEEAREILGG